MTINPTIDGVPRADLESICENFEFGRHWQAMEGVKKLRALLDAPAGTDWKDAHDTVLKRHRETFAEHVAEIERLKAAQPQAEPVAWMVNGKVYDNQSDANHNSAYHSNFKDVLQLYTEQPAPVAVACFQGANEASYPSEQRASVAVVQCSFCDVTGQEGNPWSGGSASQNGNLIYRVIGCKDHKHLADACLDEVTRLNKAKD